MTQRPSTEAAPQAADVPSSDAPAATPDDAPVRDVRTATFALG